EMRGATGRIERPSLRKFGPERLFQSQLAHHGIGEGNLPSERRMMRVLNHVIIEQLPGAGRSELASSVDQNAARVPLSHSKVGRPQRSRAPDRQSVEVERCLIMSLGI